METVDLKHTMKNANELDFFFSFFFTPSLHGANHRARGPGRVLPEVVADLAEGVELQLQHGLDDGANHQQPYSGQRMLSRHTHPG